MITAADLWKYLPGTIAATSISLATSGIAFGQALPGAGTTREQVESNLPVQEQRKPEISVDSSNAMVADDCSLNASAVRVNFTNLQFSAPGGAELNSALRNVITGLASAETGDQPISVVCKIRDRVNGQLAAAGYIARVQVPAQEVTDGTLKLVIVSGRVTEVRLRGNVGRFRSTLDNRLEQIRQMNPFNKDDAVRILLTANEIPGLKVKLSLRNAGGVPGDLIADVDAEAQTVLLLTNLQNFGSRQLGREVGTLLGEFYGLTGRADRTYVSLSNSFQWNEIHIGQIGHDFALNDKGLRLGAKISLAQSEPDIPNLDLQSRSLIAGLELSQQLLKRVNLSASVAGGFEVLNQATRILTGSGKAPFTHDQIRVAYARVKGSLRKLTPAGNQLVNIDGQVELRQGLDIFSATKTGMIEDNFAPSRFEGDAKATVLRAEVNADLSLGSRFGIGGKIFGQWANNPLLNLEEFSIGNYTIGRGYDPGANGGDRALAARIEPRLKLGKIRSLDLSTSGFYDIASISNLDLSSGAEKHRTLKSIGGGIHIVWRDNKGAGDARAVFEVNYAKTLDKALSADLRKPTSRVLVSLTTKLLPWGSR